MNADSRAGGPQAFAVIGVKKICVVADHTVRVVRVIEAVLKHTRLVEIDATWVLIYKDKEYIYLLDAESREDAEQQIAEMLFLRELHDGHHHSDQQQNNRTLPGIGSMIISGR